MTKKEKPLLVKKESAERESHEKLIAKIPPTSLISEIFRVNFHPLRFAYGAKENYKQLVIVDGKKGKPYAEIRKGTLVFSPDGQRLAYVAEANGTTFVVADEEEKKYAEIPRYIPMRDIPYSDKLILSQLALHSVEIYEGPLKFSPDSNRLAYVENRRGYDFVVVDGKMGKEYEVIFRTTLIFSPDSKRFAYVARRGEKHFVVLDGNEGKVYDSIEGLTFSPDSKRLAYKARIKKSAKWSVVVDEEEGEKYIGIGRPIFSPDSKTVVYAARVRRLLKSKYIVVVNDKKVEEYDGVGAGTITFSPNSERLAYAAKFGKKWFIVEGGNKGEGYDLVYSLLFSPDGVRLAYIAISKNKQFVVVDGNKGKGYGRIGADTLAFSPDSKHLAYLAFYRHFNFVVADAIEGKYTNVISRKDGGGIVFDSPNSFYYFILKHDLFLVEERI
jgi:Tol biopolymer transport system component